MTRTLFLWEATSALLILAVAALRALLGRRVSAGLRYALWAVVLVRLLIPVQLFTVPVPAAVLPQVERERPVETAAPFVPVPAIPETSPPVSNAALPPTEDIVVNITTLPEPEPPKVAALDVLQVLGWLWLAGSAVTAAVFVVSNASFARRLRRVRVPLGDGCSFSREKKNQKELQTCDETAENCSLPVYVAVNLPSPCLFGVLRPAVYVDTGTTADEGMLRHVLAHETVHFAHGDHIWNLLRGAALALHWWNPLVWLAAALSRRDCELACDEGALKRLGEEERFAYGRTLLALIVEKPRPIDLLSCATTMTGGQKSVFDRVTRIARAPKRRMWAAVTAVLLAAAVSACAFGQAKPDPAPAETLDAEPAQPPEETPDAEPVHTPETGLEPVYSLDGHNVPPFVRINGLDCDGAVWNPPPNMENTWLHSMFGFDMPRDGGEYLGMLSVANPRFLGGFFADIPADFFALYHPDADIPLLFLGCEDQLTPENPARSDFAIEAVIDLNSGTVRDKKGRTAEGQEMELDDSELEHAAQMLLPLIQGAAEYYNDSGAYEEYVYNTPLVRSLDEEVDLEHGEHPDLLLSYQGKEKRFYGWWRHFSPEDKTTGEVIDLDGDGRDEIVVILLDGTGTGAGHHGLYVFDASTLDQFDTADVDRVVLDAIISTGDEENYYLSGPGLDMTIPKSEAKALARPYGDIPMENALLLGYIIGYRVEPDGVHCDLPCSTYANMSYIGSTNVTLGFSRTDGFRVVSAKYVPYE